MKNIYVVLDKGREAEFYSTTLERAEKFMSENENRFYMPTIVSEEVSDDEFQMILSSEADMDNIKVEWCYD